MFPGSADTNTVETNYFSCMFAGFSASNIFVQILEISFAFNLNSFTKKSWINRGWIGYLPLAILIVTKNMSKSNGVLYKELSTFGLNP